MAQQEYEWDAQKNAANIRKHKIDFEDAAHTFNGFIVENESIRNGEKRYAAVGLMNDVVITVVYTMRNRKRRLISARRARTNEKRDYYQKIHINPP